jgi:hypothetical protein
MQDIINQLFRKMPYEALAGVHISGEEIYANTPNWLVDYSQEETVIGEESAEA